ncbi:hypothetical protein FB451DRAFT_1569265 [Mycena latifolia]|nr:hypothetical protein FB451DRAFT_1569265 [Mycena latifolia]
MRHNFISQLQSSVLLGALSLIPNNMLRYASLGIAFSLALLYAIHLKRPLTQLSQLEDVVQTTETIICDAKLHCPRDLVSLLEARVRLLKVKRSASMIQCQVLKTNTLTWKKYRLLSRDISDCVKKVEKIQNDIQLIVEAEHQRKYTDDINETEIILTSLRSPGMLVYPHTMSNVDQQSYIPWVSLLPFKSCFSQRFGCYLPVILHFWWFVVFSGSGWKDDAVI